MRFERYIEARAADDGSVEVRVYQRLKRRKPVNPPDVNTFPSPSACSVGLLLATKTFSVADTTASDLDAFKVQWGIK